MGCSMDTTDNLLLPFILPSQAQKHVTHNEALRTLDAVVQITVADRDLTMPPALPAAGARFIVAAPATGAWAGKEGQIAAWQDGAWAFLAPQAGWLAWVADEACFVARTAGGWQSLSRTFSALQALALLGLGTEADAANPFSAKLNKALWTAKTAAEGGDGDLRYTLNKETASDVVSFLLQTGYSGRAELGLIGDDNVALKVSADGSAWNTAMTVDKATGAATFPLGVGRLQLNKFTSSGTWTKPAWAKQVRVMIIGAGSGGGSGATRGAGAAVSGGSGGGPGVYVEGTLDASTLPGTVSVTVGAGGAGGASVSGTDINGINGSSGGLTSFGAYLRAYGPYANTGSGGGAATVAGGTTQGNYANPYLPNLIGGNGGTAAGTAGSSAPANAPSPGGGGGGVSAANAFAAGGNGGASAAAMWAGGVAAGGAADGSAGGAGPAPTLTNILFGGAGGGGGAGSVAGAGGVGGAGSIPGGGGGGGGAARNGQASGAGGNGARGEIWVMAVG